MESNLATELTTEDRRNASANRTADSTFNSKTKVKPAEKERGRKGPSRPPESSSKKPGGEKLVCRYCGSDDLAP